MHPYLWFRNKLHARLKTSLLGKSLLHVLERPKQGMVHVISATRLTQDAFWNNSALGQSLKSVRDRPDLQVHIHFENKQGLPAVYNQYINPAHNQDLLVFMHDDVWFDADTWIDDVRQGLGRFDVIGVAGNRRLTAAHPAWAFHSLDSAGFHWDTAFLSGQVRHGKQPKGELTRYGHYPMECQSLDGLLLAVRGDSLLKAKVRFDPQFDFHFYDLDFCRSATSRGLVLGSWGIAVTHQSEGAFGSPKWHDGFKIYRKKWD